MREREDVEGVIPFDRLPEGFAERVTEEGEPAHPRPASTLVLMRSGEGSGEGEGAGGRLEILLLRRARSAGFVPGAYVFPGGRVDAADAAPEVLARLLDVPGRDASRAPAPEYFVAAIRETFEETGLLLASGPNGEPAALDPADPGLARARTALLREERPFARVLEELDVWMNPDAVSYVAHWITPCAEPRRYDTRFFAAELHPGGRVSIDPAEITEAIWLGPVEALRRHREGSLPMVFPTVKTLETFAGFPDPGAVLRHFRGREIPAIQPELVRTETGVGIRVPEGEGAA